MMPRCFARRVALPAIVIAVAACAPLPGGAGGALAPGGAFAREDVVMLDDFSRVDAIAVSRSFVFAATENGLAVYDRRDDRWLPPLVPAAGYPRTRVTVLAADPRADVAWLGAMGAVLRYDPVLDEATSTIVAGTPDVILFDARDPMGGAYVRAGGGWTRVSSTGFAESVSPAQLPPAGARVVPPTLQQLYAAYPNARAFERLLTRDEQMRSWPVTSAAEPPDRRELWLGTWGNGVFREDPDFNRADHFPFGLLGDGGASLALASDGVWIAAGAGRAERGGLTFASTDLASWRWLAIDARSPLAAAPVRALAVVGDTAWIATARGLVRASTRSAAEPVTRLSAADGLPSDDVLALAASGGTLWAGTTAGLAAVRGPAAARGRAAIPALLTGVPVRALIASGDTLWVGSDAGLLALPPGAEGAVRVLPGEPRLARRVRALARADSVLLVATDDALLELDVAHARLLAGDAALDASRVGAPSAAAMDARTLWIGGSSGVLVVSRATRGTRFLGVGGALQGAVRDLRLDPAYAWIATDHGVVRLRRLPDGMPR